MKSLTFELINQISKEIKSSGKKHPLWPEDPLHALAVMQEEVGEAQKEVLDAVYSPADLSTDEFDNSMVRIQEEMIQAIAMGCVFLHHLDNYQWEKPADALAR